jgi:hypothetical protein
MTSARKDKFQIAYIARKDTYQQIIDEKHANRNYMLADSIITNIKMESCYSSLYSTDTNDYVLYQLPLNPIGFSVS